MAVIPGGVPVGGFISTTDDTDVYATHSDLYGKGGLKTVQTLVERDAVTEARRSWGMIVSVYDDGANTSFYKLEYGLADTDITNNANWLQISLGGVTSAVDLTDVNDTPVADGYWRWNPGGTEAIFETAIPYSVLSGAPSLATVATTGLYSDLTGQPTNLSQFTNDSGFITGYTETDTLSAVLGRGNTTGANDISVDAGRAVKFGVGSYIELGTSQGVDYGSSSVNIYNYASDEKITLETAGADGYLDFVSRSVQLQNISTAQRDAITAAEGRLVYNTTTNDLEFYDGTSWVSTAGGGSVTSVAGTASRIAVTGTATDPIIDIDAAYVGQTSITTLGTIATGTWQGTAIADAYISSAATWNALVSNVSTALSTGTVTATTYGITSDGGADDVILVEATTDFAGLLGSDKWDEIVANSTHSALTTGNPHSVTATDVGLGSVENTALSTWAGSANITTVGTIGTGTWQGTAIGDTYISSAAAWNAKLDSADIDTLAELNAIVTDATLLDGGGLTDLQFVMKASGTDDLVDANMRQLSTGEIALNQTMLFEQTAALEADMLRIRQELGSISIDGTTGTLLHVEDDFTGIIGGTADISGTLHFSVGDGVTEDYIRLGDYLSKVFVIDTDQYISKYNGEFIYAKTPQTITFSATPTYNLKDGENAVITLTANVTSFNLSNIQDGDKATIEIQQDGVGSHTFALGTVNGAAATHVVSGGGGGAITLTGTASSKDTLELIKWDAANTTAYWRFTGNFT